MRFYKIISILLTVVFVVVFSVPCYAKGVNNDNVFSPLYKLAINSSSYIYISGTSAICESSANGLSTKVSSIKVVQTLQKEWIFGIYFDVVDASWTKSVSGRNISISIAKTGLDIGSYRVKAIFTFTAYDGTTETVTAYSESKVI